MLPHVLLYVLLDGSQEDVDEVRGGFKGLKVLENHKKASNIRNADARILDIISRVTKLEIYNINVDIYSFYYTHFKITGDPCNLIGSQQCDYSQIASFFALNRILSLAHQNGNEVTKIEY